MARVRISEAASSGFLFAARRPGTVFGWGLVYLLLGLGPILFAVLIGLGMVAPLVRGVLAGDPGAEQAFVWTLVGSAGTLIPAAALAGLWAVFMSAVVACAVIRAALGTGRPGLLHLGLGADEVRLFAVMLLQGLLALAFVAALGSVLYGLARVAGAWAGGWSAPIVAAGLLLALAAAVWFWTRQSLAWPLTVVDRRIGLFRSFRETRGAFARLFAVGLLNVLLLNGLALVAVVVVYVVLGGVAVSGLTEPGRPAAVAVSIVAAALLGGGAVFATSMFNVALVMPWARALADIRAEADRPASTSEPQSAI